MKFSAAYSYNSGPSWSLDPRCKHLNHGSFGAVPVEVQAEQNRLRTLMEQNPVSWFSAAHERVGRAREEMARASRIWLLFLMFRQAHRLFSKGLWHRARFTPW